MKEKKDPFFIGITQKTYSKLRGKYRDSWIEDSFIFDSKTSKQVSLPKSNFHLGTHFNKKAARFFIFIILISFFSIIVKIAYLQIIRGDYYKSRAESNRQRIIPISSERGLVYDRNKIQLTENIPNFSLALIPQDLPRNTEQRKIIIDKLASLIDKTNQEISEIIKKYGNYSFESIVIQEDLDYETALSIQIAASDLPGLYIQRSSKRLYSFYQSTSSSLPSLSHILGYQGKLDPEELDELYVQGYLPSDIIGKTGIEKNYEKYLRGNYGKRKIEVNARGREQQTLSEEAPSPGHHIILSIDLEMQNAFEKIIKKVLDKNKKSNAAGIVLDPNNGKIISLISLPSFDNNHFSGGISLSNYQKYIENPNNPLFNRAIGGTYPSGSVIKPAIASAALEEGIISSKTSFFSLGGISVGSWFFRDWLPGGHGNTNVRKSIAWSVNTFYYYIGGGHKDFAGLGVDRINKYLKKFGLNNKLGIDIPGEKPGFLPTKEWKEQTKKEQWYIGDTYNLSIGQGDLLVTPLQIAAMTAVVANRGTLYKPHIVDKIRDPISKEETIIENEIINNNIVKAEHLNTVRLGMRDCVIYGSCRLLSSLPFTTAGKTGTAQWSSNKENHAWFISFAPFEKPEIVVVVLVEEAGEGSKIAAPIAYEFYKWWGNNRQ